MQDTNEWHIVLKNYLKHYPSIGNVGAGLPQPDFYQSHKSLSQSLLKCSWRSDIFLVFFDFFPALSLAVMRWCDGSLSRILSLFNILLIVSWWS